MEELSNYQTIRVKSDHAKIVGEHSEKILSLFNVRIHELSPDHYDKSPYVFFKIEGDTKPLDRIVVKNVQGYADSVGWGGGGEDSSYDSEGEAPVEHPEVCRTSSDTLAAEYADYVDTGYTQRLEFALKLGYTEAHVQAALHKLGPNPANNELLAELIKLGAQTQPLGSEGNTECDETRLRPIVIDGSNVAMSHGNKEVFSCRGIKICVDWFKARGHTEITVFVPKWRKEASRPNNPITGQEVLYELERERILVWTPSRLVSGKRLVCYDDRYVLRLAADNSGIVVSNDNYRDLALESPEFKRVVEQRILMYSFVNDRFMPPDDPLGRAGPTLDKFLRFAWRKAEPACPYGRKCTYGSKCKFHHPERGTAPHKTVTERLVEHAQRHLLQARSNTFDQPLHNRKPLKGKSISLPLSCEGGESRPSGTLKKTPLSRTRSHAVSCTVDLGEGPPPPPPVVEAANLHRKLQRQLSLNPYEGIPASRGRGRVHQGIGRVSSAPAAPLPAAPVLSMQQHPIQVQNHHHHHHHHQQGASHHARLTIHYHLASLFPEEQVLTAMSMHPHETNPQKICAAILSLFPPKP